MWGKRAIVAAGAAALLTLLLLCQQLATAQSVVGMKGTVSSYGMNYLKDVGLRLVQNRFTAVGIPDQAGDAFVGTYALDTITVSDIVLPATSVTVLPNEGIQAAIFGAAARLQMNWHYRVLFIADDGHADIHLTNINILIKLRVDEVNGGPAVPVPQVTVTIGASDIDLDGRLASFFGWVFHNRIQATIQDAFAQGLALAVQSEVQRICSDLPLRGPLTEDKAYDFSMAGSAAYAVDGVSLISIVSFPLRGQFLSVFNGTSTPLSATLPSAPLPDYIPYQSMLQVMIADATLTQFMSYLHAQHAFDASFTGALPCLSAQAPCVNITLPLQTDTLDYYLGGLLSAPFALKPMRLAVSTRDNPEVTIGSQSGVSVLMPLDCEFSAVDPMTGNLLPAFSLLTNTTITLLPDMVQHNLTATVTSVHVTYVGVKTTAIGSLPEPSLAALLSMVNFDLLLTPTLNRYLQQGFLLPIVNGFEVHGGTVLLYDGYAVAAGDVIYLG